VKVVLFGGSGMVGSGALLECFDDPRVGEVISVARSASPFSNAKLREVRHQDFFDYSPIRDQIAGADACFFCLGVSAAGRSEAEYTRQTYDLTLAAARALQAASPGLTFCYVSGQGTDRTGRSRMMWARVKGRTENALLAMPFKAAYMFRPGYIQPLRGVRSKTRLYQSIYSVIAPVTALLQPVLRNSMTTTVALGRALIEVAASGYASPILETADINRLAAAGRS
jgi:uncharacterized protein YbjT (DUF2867 family)